MMRLIPGKTKVQVELFKGVTLGDIAVCGVVAVMLLLVLISSLPYKLYIVLGLLFVAVILVVRLDNQPNYAYLMNILRHFCFGRRYAKLYSDEMLKERNSGEITETAVNTLFGEKEKKKRAPVSKESKREEKARQKEAEAKSKAKKKARKEEDRLLKSKKIPQEEKDAIWARRAKESEEAMRRMAIHKDENTKRDSMDAIIPFTEIKDDLIEYGGKYFGAAIEIDPVEFRFFSPHRRRNSIENSFGRVLRTIHSEYAANIVKIERPIQYDRYLEIEYDKLDQLRDSYESGMIKEEELKARVEVLYDRINQLRDLCYDKQVVGPFYYLVLFDSDKRQLENQIRTALNTLQNGEMVAKRLNTKELAVFLKYSNQLDFDEREVDKIAPEDYVRWAMPSIVDVKARTVEINHIVTHNMRMVSYPTAVGDAWLAGVMSMPGTKCVVKCRPMDRAKAVRGIDRSLQELRGQYRATGVDSKAIEIREHIQTLSELLATLQQDNEVLLEVNIYVTAYDIAATRNNPRLVQPPPSNLVNVSGMKKAVRRLYQESNFKLNNMEFDQLQAFIGAQISGWDPMHKQSRGIPSNSMAACYPWIYAHVSDEGGINLGSSQGVPVFIDFFRRDSERVNSNMVVIGKSGSGKSYATKSLLTNLAAEDSKIFILDPENEYTELADNLHGKFINVGNAQYGRLNPFHIITALDDDESDGSTVSGSYATHLQFLEEFFRQILPDCDKDAMEYLNSIIDRMYTNRGITAETDLSRLKPEDYPIFDDLYDAILAEFQQTDNVYIRTILRTLMNYIAKFSTGGRNANIWNGPSTVTTEENFIVFNFQSLLANRNSTIANAQMLLVLKYVDNEIIKNRDYNTKYKLKRKIVVVIDEAHVFIDTKFPVALDFMFQLAKRIRKYNGMQIVITQNIKDFVGSEEIARKSTAIINACQYSFIFALAPNDIQDLCKLYEKAGGINETEQEQITTAPRGQAFTIMCPSSRSTFRVEVPPDVVEMFQERDFKSRYFTGAKGAEVWEDFLGESREKRADNLMERFEEFGEEPASGQTGKRTHISFVELEEDYVPEEPKPERVRVVLEEIDEEDFAPASSGSSLSFEEVTEAAAAPTEEKRVVLVEETAAAEPKTETFAPIAAPQPTPIVVQSSSRTEEMLSELLGRFSYDAMLEEIRRTVRAEVERELEESAAKPVSEAETVSALSGVPMAETDAAEAEPLPTEEEIAVPAEPERTAEPKFAVPEPTETAPVKPEPAAEELSGETEMLSFNIMDMLNAEAKRLSTMSPIDMMDIYGEEVIDVTLEELVQYLMARRTKWR